MAVAQSITQNFNIEHYAPQARVSVSLSLVEFKPAPAPKKHLLLERLFAAHSANLIRYLRAKLREPDDAEDIAQSAFMRIRPMLEEGKLDNPVAYLYQTASNLAIDQLRQKQRHAVYIQSEYNKSLASNNADMLDHCSPERFLDAEKKLEIVNQALSSLPLDCRQAFLMHRTKGYSYSDIAREKNVSVSSVEKYILRALNHCKKALQDKDLEFSCMGV